ncbi:hypothetical protein Tco_1202542 [Tanacetum coccineum]
MSWFSRCSWCGGPFNGGNCRRCTNVSFRDEFVCNPDSISNDETPDFSYPPSQPQTSSFDQFHCFGCGDPLEDGVRCQRCTCKWCGYGLREGFCWVCASRDENSSIDVPNPNSFNDLLNSIIPLNEIISQIPPFITITPVLPTLEPEDSLIIGDENLSTILEKESDKLIKSSVEDLVPIPSKSEDTSGSNSECDLPFDDESLSDEDVPKDNVKIYSNPLFEFDDEYISSDINPLFDEVLEDIENKDPYEPDLLVTPLSDANEEEYFDPGGEIDEIDAFLDMEISTNIENGYHDLEGDIIYLESLLLNLHPKVFLDHDPKNLKDEPANKDLKNMVKVFDPGIYEKTFSPTYVSLPFEDRHYLSLTYVIQIFLPYFTYLVDSSLPLSSESEDIIFDPDISAYSFYFLVPVAYESPMEVCSSTCLVPNIVMI